MELFTEKQKRIRGKFATRIHANLYESMKNRLESQIERLNRQTNGFWSLIRGKDETIRLLREGIANLRTELKDSKDVIFNLKQTIEKNKRK